MTCFAYDVTVGFWQSKVRLEMTSRARSKAIVVFLPQTAMFQYTMVRKETLLPIVMTASRAATVLFLTILMCVISGAIAVRKLRAADPADIFK